jgi:hypothetical protein
MTSFLRSNLTRLLTLATLLLNLTTAQAALVKGIYITQSTLENTAAITSLISKSKATGINTFIVDLDRPSSRYQSNIGLLKANHLTYVARIVVFPNGGTHELIISEPYREKKYLLIQQAIAYGADEIQLDYIRYNTAQHASRQNALNILKVLQWFQARLAPQHIPLQIDVFGIASFGESFNIGHNIRLFSTTINAICPMVYPSHYDPYVKHALTPYETVYDSLQAIKMQFPGRVVPIKVYPYIELSNYRYPLSTAKRWVYIYAQIQAAEDAGANGWYAWSPSNRYDNLFKVLSIHHVK